MGTVDRDQYGGVNFFRFLILEDNDTAIAGLHARLDGILQSYWENQGVYFDIHFVKSLSEAWDFIGKSKRDKKNIHLAALDYEVPMKLQEQEVQETLHREAKAAAFKGSWLDIVKSLNEEFPHCFFFFYTAFPHKALGELGSLGDILRKVYNQSLAPYKKASKDESDLKVSEFKLRMDDFLWQYRLLAQKRRETPIRKVIVTCRGDLGKASLGVPSQTMWLLRKAQAEGTFKSAEWTKNTKGFFSDDILCPDKADLDDALVIHVGATPQREPNEFLDLAVSPTEADRAYLGRKFFKLVFNQSQKNTQNAMSPPPDIKSLLSGQSTFASIVNLQLLWLDINPRSNAPCCLVKTFQKSQEISREDRKLNGSKNQAQPKPKKFEPKSKWNTDCKQIKDFLKRGMWHSQITKDPNALVSFGLWPWRNILAYLQADGVVCSAGETLPSREELQGEVTTETQTLNAKGKKEKSSRTVEPYGLHTRDSIAAEIDYPGSVAAPKQVRTPPPADAGRKTRRR